MFIRCSLRNGPMAFDHTVCRCCWVSGARSKRSNEPLQYCSFSRKDFNRQLKCVNHSHAMFASIHAYTINTFGGAGTGESHLFIACENYFKLPIESKMVPLLLNWSSYQIYRAASIFAFAVIHLFVVISFFLVLALALLCFAIRRRDVTGTPETRHFYLYEFTSCSYDVIFVLVIEFKSFPFRSSRFFPFKQSNGKRCLMNRWHDITTKQIYGNGEERCLQIPFSHLSH